MTPIEWLLSGNTGVSSKTICAVMTGSKKGGSFSADVPYDPSDFGRCHRLLQQFPEWRDRLPEVAAAYPIWGPMVAAWDELTALYEEEMQNKSGKAPKLFGRLQKLLEEGRLADGWEKTGPGSWRSPKREVLSMGGGVLVLFDQMRDKPWPSGRGRIARSPQANRGVAL